LNPVLNDPSSYIQGTRGMVRRKAIADVFDCREFGEPTKCWEPKRPDGPEDEWIGKRRAHRSQGPRNRGNRASIHQKLGGEGVQDSRDDLRQ